MKHSLSCGLPAALALACCLIGPTDARAAGLPSSDPGEPTPPARQTRIYLGMWTSHLLDPGRGLDANSLVGVAVRGYYGATFVNSYGDRAVALGLQRTLVASRGGARPALGYRAGLVTGYDERFLGVAAKIPAIPFGQLVGSIDLKSAGIELAYAGLVASVIVSWRL